MTAYRITGLDFGEPTLPDSALYGKAVGDIVNLTLDPGVEATLLGAGVLAKVITGAPAGNVVVTADSTATIQATPYPTGSVIFQVSTLVGSPLDILRIFVV